MIYIFLWFLFHYVLTLPALIRRGKDGPGRALVVYALSPLWPVAVLAWGCVALGGWLWRQLDAAGDYPFRAWDRIHDATNR